MKVAQVCPTLCNPIDCSPPGSPVPGIFQARTMEWVVIAFSRGSSPAKDGTWVSCLAGRYFSCSKLLSQPCRVCKTGSSSPFSRWGNWRSKRFAKGQMPLQEVDLGPLTTPLSPLQFSWRPGSQRLQVQDEQPGSWRPVYFLEPKEKAWNPH